MNRSGNFKRMISSRAVGIATALAVLTLAAGALHSGEPVTMEAHVLKVVDGDTMRVKLDSGKTEIVRFLGIDAPESYARRYGYTEYLGREASRFAKELLDRKRVKLVCPSSPGGLPKRDRYRRILAFVYHENRDVCALLVEQGLARVYRKSRSSRHGELVTLEDAAKEKGLGIWNAAGEKEFYRRQYRRNRNRRLIPWFRQHDREFLDTLDSGAGKDR